MTRFGAFVALLFCVGVAQAAGSRDDFGKLLAAHKFAEARALAEGDDTLLLDLIAEAPRSALGDDADRWVARYRDAARARDGERAKALALPAALDADATWRRKDIPGATAQARAAVALLHEGAGELGASESALVLSLAAQVAGMAGDYAEAAGYAREGVALVRRPADALQALHYMRAAHFLASMEQMGGHADVAVAALRGALAEGDKLGPDGFPAVSRVLSMLCEILILEGDFAETRRIASQALERTGQGAARMYFLAHLGEAERHLGDLDAAIAHYREAIALAEGNASMLASGTLSALVGNLASVEVDAGKLDEANALQARDVALMEQVYGKDSPRLLGPLSNRGDIAFAAGDAEGAEAAYRRALEVADAHLGKDHPEAASARRGLGRVLLARGEPAQARELLTAAIAQFEGARGTEHTDLLGYRCDLALAQARLGDRDAAFAAASQVESARIALLARIEPALPETQALAVKRSVGGCNGLLLALAAESSSPERVRAAWSLAAGSRQLATRLVAARLAAARRSADAATRSRWDAWVAAARRYADALATQAEDDRLDAARRALGEAETALGSTELARLGAAPLTNLDGALKALPDGAALVAYVEAPRPALARDGRGLDGAERALYAFVESNRSLQLTSLGDASAAGALADRWYRLARDPASAGEAVAGAGKALAARAWKPLALPPGRVYVVATGPLHRINLAALPGVKEFLVEDGYRFHWLESEADLALAPAPAANSERLVLVGAPDFGKNAVATTRANCPAGTEPGLGELAGTSAELSAIASLWRARGGSPAATELRGARATVAAVREAAAGATELHFATHTVELDGGCASTSLRGVGLVAENGAPADAQRAIERVPALALAGANRGREGLLLAPEIAALDLDRTRWVVLSACDTGLGEDFGDEGVFGLRRAFRLAGARTVVMSLWKVDDLATQRWMAALYRARLAAKVDTPEAIAQASLAQLAERRAKHEPTAPFYWAGFIAAGDWR